MKWVEVLVSNGRARSGWRFLISAAMVVSAQFSVAILLGITFDIAGREPAHVLFWASCLTLPALLAVFKILTSLFEKKPLRSIGLAFCGRWAADLGMGLALGTLMVLAVAALELGLGAARFSWNSISMGQVMEGGAYYGALFAVAATNEELMFRGYPFQRLIEALGPAAAAGVSSVLFGAAHLGNPSHTWLSTLNTALVGVPLAVAYLRTRALWLPIGIHFAWNFILGYGLGFQVSGIAFTRTLFSANVNGLPWLTGGTYGPEGGGLATIVIVVATVYLSFSRSIYMSDEMRELALGAANGMPLGAARNVLLQTVDPTGMSAGHE